MTTEESAQESAAGEVLYRSAQAARLAGVSDGSLRNYSPGGRFGAYYADLFSRYASPEPGQAREFTAQDLALLRYIRSRSRDGIPHEQISEEVRRGELAADNWQPPAESAQAARQARRRNRGLDAGEGEGAALALRQVADRIADVVSLQLQDAQAQNRDLAAQILAAERRAAAAEREAELLREQLAQLRSRGLLARLVNRG